MKTPRLSVVLALTLPALSLVLFSSATVRAASIVRSESWLGRLPEPKGLNAGAITLKRPALNHWIRFEAPVVARRGTLTLSSGTLQSIKNGTLDPAIRQLAESLVGTLEVEAPELTDGAMIELAVSSVVDFGTGADMLAFARNNGFQLMAASWNPLPLVEFSAPDFASGGILDNLVTSNRASIAVPVESEATVANPAAVPVPEPTAVALSVLAVTGLLARRRGGSR